MVFEKLLENIVGQLLDYESFGITGMELNYPPFKISYKGWKVKLYSTVLNKFDDAISKDCYRDIIKLF